MSRGGTEIVFEITIVLVIILVAWFFISQVYEKTGARDDRILGGSEFAERKIAALADECYNKNIGKSEWVACGEYPANVTGAVNVSKISGYSGCKCSIDFSGDRARFEKVKIDFNGFNNSLAIGFE